MFAPRWPVAIALVGAAMLPVFAGITADAQINQTLLDVEIQPLQGTFRWSSFGDSGVGQSGERLSNQLVFPFRVVDNSIQPAGETAPVIHQITFRTEWEGGQPEGWYDGSGLVPVYAIFPGQSEERTVVLQHDTTTRTITARLRVIANISVMLRPDVYHEEYEIFSAQIYPAFILDVSLKTQDPRFAYNAEPDRWVDVPVEVQNLDLYPHKIAAAIAIQESEGIDTSQLVPHSAEYYFQPFESHVFYLRFRTPKDKFWFYSDALTYTVTITNAENEAVRTTVTGTLVVDGFYISTPLKVGASLLPLLLGFLIFVVARARAYKDQRFLGKPLPPWKIPEEALALRELKVQDPRAFYLTRYFLMVEEYESALNWFHDFKGRTRRELQRASTVVQLRERAERYNEIPLDRFDRRASRLKRRVARRQERQRLKLENRLDRLRTRLGRTYEKHYEKDHSKWESQVAKLTKKANRPWAKAHQKWAKQTTKIIAKWEKPFAKEKARYEKRLAKAHRRYEALVKREDKETWKAWRERVKENLRENEVRQREGQEILPPPELVSEKVGPPELPEKYVEPEPPELPPEPKAPKVRDLPPEPELKEPILEESHYARKTRRLRRKSERRVQRLQEKLDRALAKNERSRVRALAKAERKQRKLIRKSERAGLSSRLARLVSASPQRAHVRHERRVLKARARQAVREAEEHEQLRLQAIGAEARRKEAELAAQTVRERFASQPGIAEPSKVSMARLREEQTMRLAKERQDSESRLRTTRDRIEADLRQRLAEVGSPSTPRPKPS